MDRFRPVGYGIFALWLVAIGAVFFPFALERHLHVDEVQVIYNAALWGVHDLGQLANYNPPYVVLLSWIVSGAQSSAEIAQTLRAVMFVLFACHLVVIAVAQPYFRSVIGRALVLVAVTLFHPLWAHGFEVRHDSVVSFGAVLLFAIAQSSAREADAERAVPVTAPLVAGLIAGLMMLSSTKSILWSGPFVACGIFASIREPKAVIKPAALSAIGLAVGIGLSLGLLAVGGHLDRYLAAWSEASQSVVIGRTFSPTKPLYYTALSSWVVFSGAAVFVVLLVQKRAWPARASIVTLFFLVWSVLCLFINPVPYTYNLIHVVPFVFFAALDACHRIGDTFPQARIPVIAGALLASGFIFGRVWTTNPYWKRTTQTQLAYMDVAERMTAPDDPVLDGAGLVAARRPPGKHWMVHSLFLEAYKKGLRTTFEQHMVDSTPPVLITSYRWNGVSARDKQVRDRRYVQLYPHLWVLGGLAAEGGDFETHRTGRYRVVDLEKNQVATGTVAGGRIPASGVVSLTAGPHVVETESRRVLVHWLGPKLEAPIPLDHEPDRLLYFSD